LQHLRLFYGPKVFFLIYNPVQYGTHPTQTYQSMKHMVLHPVETGKYMGNAIAESYNRDMVNDDAESRSHWVTYTLGTSLGTKEAGNAIKSTKVRASALKAAKESVQAVTNKAANDQMPNLFPYAPQHQLAPVGPVPYNVVDGVNLRDQMMMSAKNFSEKGKNNNKKSIIIEQTSRNGAFNEAKRDAKIPRGQQPDIVKKEPMRHADHEGGHVMKDSNGHVIYTREYHYTNQDGKKVIIQDHSAGHSKGNQGPHYNVTPSENPRTGKVPDTKDHYPVNK